MYATWPRQFRLPTRFQRLICRRIFLHPLWPNLNKIKQNVPQLIPLLSPSFLRSSPAATSSNLAPVAPPPPSRHVNPGVVSSYYFFFLKQVSSDYCRHTPVLASPNRLPLLSPVEFKQPSNLELYP